MFDCNKAIENNWVSDKDLESMSLVWLMVELAEMAPGWNDISALVKLGSWDIPCCWKLRNESELRSEFQLKSSPPSLLFTVLTTKEFISFTSQPPVYHHGLLGMSEWKYLKRILIALALDFNRKCTERELEELVPDSGSTWCRLRLDRRGRFEVSRR